MYHLTKVLSETIQVQHNIFVLNVTWYLHFKEFLYYWVQRFLHEIILIEENGIIAFKDALLNA